MTREFAANVFDLRKLEECIPGHLYTQFRKSVDQKAALGSEVAEFIAREIKKWSEANGATHFTHWFQPLTGLTAGKENSFLDHDGDGRIISRFSGRDLIMGEPDASSFPHGGMRSTFEARGYAAWDPSSPVFIVAGKKDRVLYIPSVFFGYNGKVLDKKTPLLRSQKALGEAARSLLRLLGRPSEYVRVLVGAEQEFFLVSEEDYRQRPDLSTLGRVIFGSRPPRGQQMGDHYFGAIPGRVRRFLEDVEAEASAIGIPVKTRHNEVAPNQFEVAPLHEEANIASDHNQMLMELLRRCAREHGMVCLFHEKPFAFFNGSGKHINWSLADSAGRNLFAPPGGARGDRLVYVAFLAGFIAGICRHHDMLQAVLASPGNELRLGGHEAPPSIVSVYLGEELEAQLADLEGFLFRKPAGGRRALRRHEEYLPPIPHDSSDRNRTSPVAFTGNKFEFRMPGASASIAFPVAAINLAVCDGLQAVRVALEGAGDPREQAARIGAVIEEHRRIVYGGDNYAAAWQVEAERRGLFIPADVPAAIARLKSEKNIALFSDFQVLAPDEIDARVDIKTEIYVKTVEMELRVGRYLLRAYIIPAALRNEQQLLEVVRDFPSEILRRQPGLLDHQYDFIGKFAQKINRAMELLQALDEDNEKLKEGGLPERARFCSQTVRPRLAEAAALAEKIEDRVDRGFWPLPRADDILFR